MKKPAGIDLMDGFYVLDGKTPRPATNILEWGAAFESDNRRVAETQTDLYRVSTVFLGIAHGAYRNGPPMLFETMVFTSEEYGSLVPAAESLDNATVRYSNWDDAEAGHATQVRRLERQIETLLSSKSADSASRVSAASEKD